MTHARIPDFTQPPPTRRTSAQTDRRRRSATARRLALPNRAAPDAVETRCAAAPGCLDTAARPALPGLTLIGELLAAAAIIVGGIVATGLATLF